MESIVPDLFILDVTCNASQDAQDDGILLGWWECRSGSFALLRMTNLLDLRGEQKRVLRLRCAPLRMTALLGFEGKSVGGG